MKNTKLEKIISRLAQHYINRYWVLLIDTVTSVISTLLVMSVFDYFMSRDVFPVKVWLAAVGISALISLISFVLTRSYAGVVRHTTMREMWRISMASILKALLVITALLIIFSTASVSSVMLGQILIFAVLDMILTLFLLIMVRVLLTNVYNLLSVSMVPDYYVKNALIYGTGDDSVNTLNFLEKTLSTSYRCAGFITPDNHDKAKLLCGYRIYHIDNKRDFSRLVSARMISAMVFPSNVTARNEQDRMVKFCSERRIQILVRPSLANFDDDIFRNKIREIKIEDLLGRDEIKISILEIREFLTDKVVVVTGGAGSIGGELCRQLVNMPIRKLILVDFAETPMHNMQLELRSQAPRVDKKFIIADVRNKDRIDALFDKYRPNVVFHAAAYKHVPLMESNPVEAVQANVFGTKNVVDASIRYNIEKFVMISTDKAVNPTNVMGASKRIAEIYVQTVGKEIAEKRMPGKTKFITTRFGNVLGSNGSVIPLFKEQIAKGGPVTVTDPRIIRYFMTISEACSLVLEAATMGEGNDIFVFDMGEPVKIDDLAKKMISLAGLQLGKDIEIKYVGLRPGEKLYEELLKDEENTLPTVHKKIFRAKVREYDINVINQELENLWTAAHGMKKDDTVLVMKSIVPEYKSANSRYQRLDVGGG
ncbi:MAG TPA: polysaccharide biosynthesis protein [Candidatus Coprenecus merdipullorum]|nr:polysaccharide biosynthesis protein [Candidatus Coprenecus merdipullorum]